MHEMRKSDAIHHHTHRHVDERKDVYNAQRLNDKDHHRSMGTSTSGRTDQRSSSKAHGVTQIPGAIRVCGDWSEQLSSNGKLYFFNIKTKLSQWERPKDWSNSRAIDVKKEKSKAFHNRVSSKQSEGSSSSHHGLSRQHKTGYSHASDIKKMQLHNQQQHARQRTNHDSQTGKDFRDRDYRTANTSSAKDRDYRDIDYRDARSSDSRLSNNVDSSRSQANNDRDYRSASSSHRDHRQSLARQSSEVGRSLGKDHNDGDISKDERSRSSNSTPRSAHGNSKAAETETDSSSMANGNEGTSSALVQTLSSVLNQVGKSNSDDRANSASLEGNLKNALQMLLNVAAQNQHIAGTSADAEQNVGVDEPRAKMARRTHPVDQHIDCSLQVCQTAGKVLGDLKGIFEERYTSHVQGWPTEQLERQCVKLCDENHQFIVNHTSQLGTYMKISRSEVRSAEVLSTLQEQRILYLRQQVKDLEKSSVSAPFT